MEKWILLALLIVASVCGCVGAESYVQQHSITQWTESFYFGAGGMYFIKQQIPEDNVTCYIVPGTGIDCMDGIK